MAVRARRTLIEMHCEVWSQVDPRLGQQCLWSCRVARRIKLGRRRVGAEAGSGGAASPSRMWVERGHGLCGDCNWRRRRRYRRDRKFGLRQSRDLDVVHCVTQRIGQAGRSGGIAPGWGRCAGRVPALSVLVFLLILVPIGTSAPFSTLYWRRRAPAERWTSVFLSATE